MNGIMRNKLIANLLIAAVAFCAFGSASLAKVPADFTGKVVKVSDGDTYIVKRSDGSEVKVRIHVADTPEVAHYKTETDQPYGRESLDYATKLLLGKKVSVHPVAESYGRIVADLKQGDTDVATDLITNGMAMVYPQSRPRPTAKLVEAQSQAKESKVGLWSNPKAVPPWEWRATARERRILKR